MDFSFKFFDLLASNATSNLVYSPLSLTCSLLMILFGARGPGAMELAKALFYNSMLNTFDESFNETSLAILRLRGILDRLNNSNGTNLSSDIFLDHFMTVNPEFTLITKELFKTDITSIDFSGRKDGNPITLINKKISSKSSDDPFDQLKNVIQFIPPNSKMLMVNVLSFKRDWKYKFDQRRSKLRPFYAEDGSVTPVDSMFLMNNLEIGSSEYLNATLVKLPYKSGKLTCLILLPREGLSLKQLINNVSLHPKALYNLLENDLQKVKTKIILPKFNIESSESLIEPLRSLGIRRIFDAASADFSGISHNSTGLCVSDVIQQAKISIDESGSRASAATAAVFKQRSLSLSEEFIVNRPFLFIIGQMDKRSLSDILFMGSYTKPVVT